MLAAARLAVFQRTLEGLAEEMGVVLVRSALSSNIKERRDSSTAIFDARGDLLAQAAHIPVHVGSMQSAVAAVVAHDPAAGEVWAVNDPYAGGTHLPDITLVTAVAGNTGGVIGFAAARAHHADVGGSVPGSMSAAAAHIDEEGVRIPPTRVGDAAGFDAAVIEPLVARMRQPGERRGDLLAQHAALAVARTRMPALASDWGGDAEFQHRATSLLEHGERRARAALARQGTGSGQARAVLELPGGRESLLDCRIELRGAEGLVVDLSGSGDQTATSLNCPRSVTLAATLFAVRVAFDPDLPTSGGVERAVELRTRPGSVVHAVAPAAVAGGNVEVSSVVVELVLEALAAVVDVPAEGQATMNNLVIGNERFSYYETIAGGQGASARLPGPTAVQVAMTNTRNTPIEALEREFPLEVVRYSVRRGSGGAGARPGGDGVVRVLRVLEECDLSILAQRRRQAPAGRQDGQAGTPGEQLVDGRPIDGNTTLRLGPGSTVEVRTPGGGGHGAPPKFVLPARDRR